MSDLDKLKSELKKAGNEEKARLLQRFFKTGKGQYGEGDIFLGVTVPEIRAIAKKYFDLNFKELQELLNSKIHEERLVSLFILIKKYKKADESDRLKIFNFYLKHAKQVNNWDLVDLTAHKIVGNWLLDKPRDILYGLAKSDNLWERRISVIATFAFIVRNDFKDAIKVAEMHLKDKHDLIHKAVGWMLREIGKKDVDVLRDFLKLHSKEMPRTMLRYSIEKFDREERKKWMKK